MAIKIIDGRFFAVVGCAMIISPPNGPGNDMHTKRAYIQGVDRTLEAHGAATQLQRYAGSLSCAESAKDISKKH
jgi:hypothetical protein